ncbi:hypothetical protein LINGRAHAP2_LOCUS25917, partial [Linum grandiflorum]
VVDNVELPGLVDGVDGSLRIFESGVLLLLDLDEEAAEVIRGHEAIGVVVVGVGSEELLDLVGGFRDGELESPAEAEAYSVSLFRHYYLSVEWFGIGGKGWNDRSKACTEDL